MPLLTAFDRKMPLSAGLCRKMPVFAGFLRYSLLDNALVILGFFLLASFGAEEEYPSCKVVCKILETVFCEGRYKYEITRLEGLYFSL